VARLNSYFVGTLLLSALVGTAPTFAADRVALVIGNGIYQKVPTLPNPPRDAADIGRALERLNFKVTQLSNASAAEMRKAIVDFGRSTEGSEMAVVFYAGHGMEVGGENWLIQTPNCAAMPTSKAKPSVFGRLTFKCPKRASSASLFLTPVGTIPLQQRCSVRYVLVP